MKIMRFAILISTKTEVLKLKVFSGKVSKNNLCLSILDRFNRIDKFSYS